VREHWNYLKKLLIYRVSTQCNVWFDSKFQTNAMPPSPEWLNSVLVDGEMNELAKPKAMYHDKRNLLILSTRLCVRTFTYCWKV